MAVLPKRVGRHELPFDTSGVGFGQRLEMRFNRARALCHDQVFEDWRYTTLPMQLSTYIQRTRALGDLKVPATAVEAIEAKIAAGGATFDDVLTMRSEQLSPLALLGIWRAGTRHHSHQQYLQDVAARRRNSAQAQIPWALLKQTISRHEVAVLERAEALSPSGRSAEHRRRDAIKATVNLWNSCLAITRKEASLSVTLDTDIPALVEEYGSFVGSVFIKDVSAHRWLGMRRGERLGALRFEFKLPFERMLEQVKARSANLSAVSGGRDDETLLDVLVLTDLEEWALSLKDEEAQFLAMRSASNAYLNMVSGDPTNYHVLAAVNVPPRGPLGVAVILKDGRLVGHGTVEPGRDLIPALERVIGSHPVEALVLSAEAGDAGPAGEIARGFSSLEIVRTTSKAITVGMNAVANDLPTSVKGALVLARRVAQPKMHWLELDPVALGLAEYQQELDESSLRTFYADMQALARAGVPPSVLQKAPKAAAPKARVSVQTLNPLIRNVEDLRPGMEVEGVVTNITQFGAFLNLGLANEGLVHVSELADHFVSDPNEVVTVGQQVKAHVLGIDRARRRISLSMRTDRKQRRAEPVEHSDRIDGPRRPATPLDDIPGMGRRGAHRPVGSDRQRGPASNLSRAEALAELEALFNKK